MKRIAVGVVVGDGGGAAAVAGAGSPVPKAGTQHPLKPANKAEARAGTTQSGQHLPTPTC